MWIYCIEAVQESSDDRGDRRNSTVRIPKFPRDATQAIGHVSHHYPSLARKSTDGQQLSIGVGCNGNSDVKGRSQLSAATGPLRDFSRGGFDARTLLVA